MLQRPSPHRSGQLPQSCGQSLHDSVKVHRPSPQSGGQTPQSNGQDEQVSTPSQT